MIRKFLKDTSGNYALMTAAAMVPIMGALALAIDYAEISREREVVRNALDAANMAVARRMLDGAMDPTDTAKNDELLKEYAAKFYTANLGTVNPANAPLTVTLPNNTFGGGAMEMETTLTYKPYFLPVAAALLGKTSDDINLSFVVKSVVRLQNTIEVALVLDNSGSMSTKGYGTSSPRIELLRTAATQLVETMASQAGAMRQINEPVRFGVVPFSASVNVGPEDYAEKAWLDTEGLSPVHHENFDWSTMTKANAPLIGNRYAEFDGTVWRKRGDGWGATKDKPLTRFSLYEDITVASDRKKVGSSYTYTYSKFSSWKGCVEARPAPYNTNDAPAITRERESFFVPMFAPDEAKHLWRLDIDGDGDIEDGTPDLNRSSFGYSNNWWADWANSDAATRQSDMRKYFRIKPYGSTAAGAGTGPNFGCTTTPITPLTDISTPEGMDTVTRAINSMAPGGYTNIPEGTAWGWRVVSSGAPFAEGRPDGERGNDKVVIVLTDGANTYQNNDSDDDDAGNISEYAAYGYIGHKYDGNPVTRLFYGTTKRTYQAAMDEHLKAVCKNAKGDQPRTAKGAGNDRVIVMTIALDLNETKQTDRDAITTLTTCASFSRTTLGKKLFWNATGANLMTVFQEIADELSNLRIVG